jgi:excisionase family DNA binding protein
MLTVEEVAAILKVQPLTVRQMFRESRIRGFKIGKAWRTTMPILEEDIVCMSRGVAPPRLDQAAPATGDGASAAGVAAPRKRRAKSAPDTAEPIVSDASEAPVVPDAPAVPEAAAAPEAVPAEVAESPVVQEAPAAEEPEAGGKRKRKSAPEENVEQQLLF